MICLLLQYRACRDDDGDVLVLVLVELVLVVELILEVVVLLVVLGLLSLVVIEVFACAR